VHDLKDQIHSLFETGLLPIAADGIASRDQAAPTPFPSRARQAITVRRVTAVTVGLAAAACAAALVATQVGGAPTARPAWPAVIDAAYVRHLAAASQLALARSGQAAITETQTEDKRESISTFRLTFSGANWNDYSTYAGTVHGVLTLLVTQLGRVVDGRAYSYRGHTWYHITGPHAVTSLEIYDPRRLLAELSPSASFVRAGTAVVDGVPVEHLRATTLAALPAMSPAFPFASVPPPANTVTGSVRHITSLDVWVDHHGVVRRLAWSTDSPTWFETSGGPGSQQVVASGGHMEQSMVVTFSAIGQPQVITAPPNAIPTPGPS
jgi:hypothetical protein